MQINKDSYDQIYAEKKTFLRYPADRIIRWHNMHLKKEKPAGTLLDYGCGSGNNMKFFLEQGYDVHGTDITESAVPLCVANGIDENKITITPPNDDPLPFDDQSFDIIISNQVLYYIGGPVEIRNRCEDLNRILRPGGFVFFTMMSDKNYYVSEGHASPRSDGLHELKIEGDHRLSGFHQVFRIVKSEEECEHLFDIFECLSIGYFDQSMLSLKSNHHWIFIGKKIDS